MNTALILILLLTKPYINDKNVKVTTSLDVVGSIGLLNLERIEKDVKFNKL